MSMWCYAIEPLYFSVGEWSPYIVNASPNNGLFPALLELLLKESSYRPVYLFRPWLRAEKDVQDGKAFATFPFMKHTTRDDTYYFSEPFLLSKQIVIGMKGHDRTRYFSYKHKLDLKGFKVGIVVGSIQKQELKQFSIDVEESETVEVLFEKLVKGRIDLIVEDYFVARQEMEKRGIQQFIEGENPFQDNLEYRLMVSKTYPQSEKILAEINSLLNKHKSSNAWKETIDSYRHIPTH